MSDFSNLINDIIDWFHHGTAPASLAPDAQKLLDDVQRVASGISGSAKDAPALVSDVELLVAELTAVAAARGLNLEADLALIVTLRKAAGDVAKAISDFKLAAGLVAATPLQVPAALG